MGAPTRPVEPLPPIAHPPAPLSSFLPLTHFLPHPFPRLLLAGDPCYDVVKRLVVEATCSTGGGAQLNATDGVFAQAFVESASSGGGRKVLVVNKGSAPADVTLAGATGGSWQYIDESTAYGPAATTTLAADTWTLAPYGLGIVRLSS